MITDIPRPASPPHADPNVYPVCWHRRPGSVRPRPGRTGTVSAITERSRDWQARQHQLKGTRMARQAVVGPEIVRAVDAKTKTGMNRSQAFAAVAEERGSRPGTVAANYYRVQRKENPQALQRKRSRRRARSKTTTVTTRTLTAQSRRTGAAQTPGRRSAGSGALDINRLTNDLVAAVNALAGAVASQQRETEALRARLDEVRSALG
jgi:hypothetical protein